MSIRIYVVFLFFVQLFLGPKKMANAQATVESQDPTLEIPDSLEEDNSYFFQNRVVERLHALNHFVDDQISKLLSAERNPPFIKLLKGICPELLVQEPVGRSKFHCHALGTNNCFCFSHKKATWYRAEAFCRQFGMTLAHTFQGQHKVAQWIMHKVNDASAVALTGERYWTSATDRFIPGQMISMNTGHLLYESNNSNSSVNTIESCLKFSSLNPPFPSDGERGNFPLEYISSPCSEENHFLCHKFLRLFPLNNAFE